MNYFEAFIAVSEDSPVGAGTVPPTRGAKQTVAARQYDMLSGHPYQYTQEDVLFESSTLVRDNPEVTAEEKVSMRKEFFSKSQACLRTSALGKSYGWGIHFDENGKAAIYGVESKEYERLKHDSSLAQTRAMRSTRQK